jgi:hypothetical protein
MVLRLVRCTGRVATVQLQAFCSLTSSSSSGEQGEGDRWTVKRITRPMRRFKTSEAAPCTLTASS